MLVREKSKCKGPEAGGRCVQGLSRGAGGEERDRGQSREVEDGGGRGDGDRTAWTLQAPVRSSFLL